MSLSQQTGGACLHLTFPFTQGWRGCRLGRGGGAGRVSMSRTEESQRREGEQAQGREGEWKEQEERSG